MLNACILFSCNPSSKYFSNIYIYTQLSQVLKNKHFDKLIRKPQTFDSTLNQHLILSTPLHTIPISRSEPQIPTEDSETHFQDDSEIFFHERLPTNLLLIPRKTLKRSPQCACALKGGGISIIYLMRKSLLLLISRDLGKFGIKICNYTLKK